MNVKAVLFDLDGTLLPMDQDQFVMSYFMGLAKWLAPKGYDSGKLKEVFWSGVAAMVKNDGTRTNEEAFWKVYRCRAHSTRPRLRVWMQVLELLLLHVR